MIDKIVNNGFCMGCGLCSSVLGQDKCQMRLAGNGFYYPLYKGTRQGDAIIKSICPGIHVEDNKKHDVWGHVVDVAEAWSTDNDLRHKAASGGVSSALALYLLETKKVDGILQVGLKDGSFLYNELKISSSREDIITNAQSRYAPALTLNSLKQVLDLNSDVYAFVGKPCDIAGINNFIGSFPQYKNRIKYTISIFCAGMPSYNASRKTWEQSGRKDDPVFLKYRGEGWPGNFKAVWADGQSYEISYNDSWGKILGRDLGFRCKICPDGIGMLADISLGDSWNTKNGYPDFTEADGRNFCFIRSERGKQLFNEAVDKKYIAKKSLEVNKVKDMQAYQYSRRHHVGWRIMAAQVSSLGMLHFKGLGLIKLALSINKKMGLREFAGTIKRSYKNKKSMKNIYQKLYKGGVRRNSQYCFSCSLIFKAA